MHHTDFKSGNSANHNGDLSGKILFTNLPTLDDIKDLLLAAMAERIIGHVEDHEFDIAKDHVELADRLKRWPEL